MNASFDNNEFLRRWAPPVAGVLFILLFMTLGFWQLDRAAQKNAMELAFENSGEYLELHDGFDVQRLQSVKVSGHYLADQQILIRNIVQNGQFGYYVISGFQSSHYSPLLVVNRGWIATRSGPGELADIALDDRPRTLHGRIGGLPKVGIRQGPAFSGDDGWPRKAAWPTLAELATVWKQQVSPIVLLLEPDEKNGFSRQWQPAGSGPMKHYNYAFQWFAMAAATLAMLALLLRQRRKQVSRA